jgi:hypothetical protein
MPFASDAQRKFLFARKPHIARKFAKDKDHKKRKRKAELAAIKKAAGR